MQTKPWNYASHVKFCPDCEGTGTIAAHRRATINDPFPETDCDCGLGEHEPECEVCGFNTEVDGYDCFACDIVGYLTTEAFFKVDPQNLAYAVKAALTAGQAHEKAAKLEQAA